MDASLMSTQHDTESVTHLLSLCHSNERLGYMIHYMNKNVFRCYFEKNYIGFAVKFFISFQNDMMRGSDKSKFQAVYEESLDRS